MPQSKKDLQDLCRTLGLSDRGTWEELDKRINEEFAKDLQGGSDEEEGCNVDNMTVNDLREYCSANNLYTGGNREELMARVRKHLQYGNEAEGDDNPYTIIRGWNKTGLKDWLREHGLSCGGNRQAMEERIVTYWHAFDDEDSTDEDAELAFSAWTNQDMKEWLIKNDLPSGGNRKALLQRILDNWHLYCTANDEEDDDNGLDFSDWTRNTMQSWLINHGLPSGGNRAALEQRMIDNWHLATDDEEESGSESDDADNLAGGISQLNVNETLTDCRALIVACSYKGTGSELSGTLEDADRVIKLLKDVFNFTDDEIRVLRDDSSRRSEHPTKANIKTALNWLVKDAARGDSLFFYFSGHGTQEIDVGGLESSGFNQCICPVDCDDRGNIKDSYLHQVLVKPLPKGVTLHALIDSCHSGTIMNLPWNAKTENGGFKYWTPEYPIEKLHKWSSSGGNVFQFSASASHEYANEFGRRRSGKMKYSGAATHAFCSAILRHRRQWGSNISYGNLLQAMSEELQLDRRFKDQTPELSSTLNFDCNSVDICFDLE